MLQAIITNFLSLIFTKQSLGDDFLNCPLTLETSFRHNFYSKRRSISVEALSRANKLPRFLLPYLTTAKPPIYCCFKRHNHFWSEFRRPQQQRQLKRYCSLDYKVNPSMIDQYTMLPDFLLQVWEWPSLPSKPCLSKNFTFTILMDISYFAQVSKESGMQRRRGHLLTFDRIRCLGLQGYDATQ